MFLVFLGIYLISIPQPILAQESTPEGAGITIGGEQLNADQQKAYDTWLGQIYGNPTLAQENIKLTKTVQGTIAAVQFLDWSLKIHDVGIKDRIFLKLWSWVFAVASAIYVLLLIAIGLSLILHLEWIGRFRRYFPTLLISFGATIASFWLAYALLWLTARLQELLLSGITTQDLFYFKFDGDFLAAIDPGLAGLGAYQNTLGILKSITWTSYILGGIFVLRLILIWFLVIVSPIVFPFMIYPATSAASKAWLREFCRWLVVGPLLALFITAVATIWRGSNYGFAQRRPTHATQSSGIPIQTSDPELKKPTANPVPGSNIILSPPGVYTQDITYNNLNDPDTYSRMIVALLMLWAAAILPFLLTHATIVYVGREQEKTKFLTDNRLMTYLKNLIRPPAAKEAPPASRAAIPAAAYLEPSPVLAKIRAAARPPARLSTEEALHHAGFGDLPEAFASQTNRLQNLAANETKPELTRRVGEVSRAIANPDIAPPAQKPKIQTLKDQLFLNRLAGDRSAGAAFRLIERDYSGITSDNLPAKLKQENLKKAAESILKLNLTDKLQALQDKGDSGASQAQSKLFELQSAAREFAGAQAQNQALLADKLGQKLAFLKDEKDPGSSKLKGMVVDEAASGNQDAKEALWSLDEQGKEIDQTPSVAFDKETAEFKKGLSQEKRDDYQKTTHQLAEFFRTAPVPGGQTRLDWLKGQITQYQQILKTLFGGKGQKEAALEKLKNILSFLVLGDYDIFEVALYLKAKIEAARTVYQELARSPAENPGDSYYHQ